MMNPPIMLTMMIKYMDWFSELLPHKSSSPKLMSEGMKGSLHMNALTQIDKHMSVEK